MKDSGKKAIERVSPSVVAIFSPGGLGGGSGVLITKDGVKTPLAGAQPYDNLKSVVDTLLGQ